MTITKYSHLPKVYQTTPYLGCDPEFFFKTGGEVIGAENIIPKGGLTHGNSKFVIDGVQAELNPSPDTCRARLANQLGACFRALKAELDKQGKRVVVDFSRSVEISKCELEKLDKENQKFGCMPSQTIYKPSEIKIENIDATKHLQRSAGGHIHIGKAAGNLRNLVDWAPEKVVQILDIVVGNTCVLIDRDPGNVERRKLYGRAGEYRLPKHGLEYRTPSNFWLEAYPLMSMIFGLTRTAVSLVSDTTNGKLFYDELTKAVDQEKIAEAINTNNFELAYDNFKKIEPILEQVTPEGESWVLTKTTMPKFHYFVNTVKEKGLKHFFPQDPLDHWCTLPEAHGGGAFFFLRDLRVPPAAVQARAAGEGA